MKRELIFILWLLLLAEFKSPKAKFMYWRHSYISSLSKGIVSSWQSATGLNASRSYQRRFLYFQSFLCAAERVVIVNHCHNICEYQFESILILFVQ